MTKYYFIGLLFSISYLHAYGQKEDYQWRVGFVGIVDFNNSNADTFSIAIPTQSRMDYTNASICDSAGHLLFFTNGVRIYNKNKDIMLNGDGLNPTPYGLYMASNSGAMPINGGAVIIQRPDHPQQYYLFHQTYEQDTWPIYCKTLYQTVIDMTLDGGLGAVTNIKNYPLYGNDTLLGGDLAAVRHANGRDWWLISKKGLKPVFYKWLITPDSIMGPFAQSNQPASATSADYDRLTFGQACFSPNGDKYAVMYMSKNMYVYDFDRCTGILTHLVHKTIVDSAQTGTGCAFSASGRYLYVCTQYLIYQYDMLASDILGSEVTVGKYEIAPICGTADRFNLMKLAPDNKIYIANDNGCGYFLHAIEFPDSAGLACKAQSNYLRIPYSGGYSIPTIPDYRLGKISESPCDTITYVPDLTKNKTYNISVYPNPTTGFITLRFESKGNEQYVMQMLDLTGRIVFSADGKTTKGINHRDLDISKLEKGIYFINIHSIDRNDLVRIILQ